MNPFGVESLEPRALLAATFPTALEQYFIELINRARINPTGEAKSFGISLNEGLNPGTISSTSKQPLAVNPRLNSAARKYSTTLLNPGNPQDGVLSHTINGNPWDRAAAEGYTYTSFPLDNLVWVSHSNSSPSQDSVLRSHELLFKDFTATFEVVGRGHRTQQLKEGWKEIGVGLSVGPFGSRNAQTGVQLFGTANTGAILTGVAITDAVVDDDFYTPGEGLGNIAIKAKRVSDKQVFSTKTWAAGGYSLALAPGVYHVTASGGALGRKGLTYYNVVVGTDNVKRDFIKPGGKDVAAPFATAAQVGPITVGAKTTTFTVAFSDLNLIKSSSIGPGDIVVTGPGGFKQTAAFVSKTPSKNGMSVLATYSIKGPGGTWDAADNKTYTIKLNKKAVSDNANHFIPAGSLGTFDVALA